MTIRKAPGTYMGPTPYLSSGSLDGQKPGRRRIQHLEVRRLDGVTTAEGLQPLAAFVQLEELELERVSRVDLEPLVGLERLRSLRLREVEGVDLAPLAKLAALEHLSLQDLADCRVPSELALPHGLLTLGIFNDGAGADGESVRESISAINWQDLAALQVLVLAVGGLEPLAPVEVDLGFLRHLQQLRHLQMRSGVWHRGPEPSPLEPPFDGLSPVLEKILIDAWDPEPVAAALRERYGHDRISVSQRVHPDPAYAAWTLHAPEREGEPWLTYGSLCDAARGEGGSTERAALTRARRLLRAADPGLLARLDFDQESSGTGISAPSRADLETALRLLGITPPPAAGG